MGKGDRRSRKGKIWAGSYGNSRKRKKSKAAFVPKVKKSAPAKKEAVAEVEGEAKKKAPAKKAAAPKKKAAPKKTEE
jgi:30S ribosomal protein S31